MRLVLASIAAMAIAAPASAEILTPQNAADIAQVLRDEGYGAIMESDARGNPKIRSSAEGVNFTIYFYDCQNGDNCRSIQFHAGFDTRAVMTPEQMNQWNRRKRYTRAYVTDNGDPIIKYDINMDYGVERLNFADSFDIWRLLLSDFKVHINW